MRYVYITFELMICDTYKKPLVLKTDGRKEPIKECVR